MKSLCTRTHRRKFYAFVKKYIVEFGNSGPLCYRMIDYYNKTKDGKLYDDFQKCVDYSVGKNHCILPNAIRSSVVREIAATNIELRMTWLRHWTEFGVALTPRQLIDTYPKLK
jgi:hypothetical protein